MATAAKTSPLTTVPAFAEGEQEQQKLQEIQELQRKLLQAYEARPLFDPTLLAMARGFGAPSRTGSFFESLGNVAGELGPVQQAQQEKAQELAAMRLQLAQAELGGLQQARGQKKFAELVNRLEPGAPGVAPAEGAPTEGTPAPGVKVTPGGVFTPELRAVTPRDIALLKNAPGMEKQAKILEDMVKQQRDRFKTEGQVVYDMDNPSGPKVVMDMRPQGEQKPYDLVVDGQKYSVPMTPIEYGYYSDAVRSGRGKEFFNQYLKDRVRESWEGVQPGGALQEVSLYLPNLDQRIVFRATARQAAQAEALVEKATRTGDYAPAMRFLQSLGEMKGVAEPAAEVARPREPAKPGEPVKAAERPVPQTMSDLAQLPIAEQFKIMGDRIASGDKVAQDEISTVMKVGSPNVVIPSNTRLNEIISITRSVPNAFGLIQRQDPGLIKGLVSAAQEGAQVGPYRVSVPANEFLKGLKLTGREYDAVRRIVQLLDEEFFSRASQYKSVLGPQMSNADAILMKAPIASPTDSARMIEYWALNGILGNKQFDDLYRSYDDWASRTGGRQPARSFWSKEGRDLLGTYANRFADLQKTFGPR